MGYDQGRISDLFTLEKELKGASPERVKHIMHTIHNIQNETTLQKSMREALVKASRNGDVQALKEIREYVAEKAKYQNG
jgi:hypothetical protein